MNDNFSEIPKAINQNDLAEQFLALVEIIKILRLKCPWDSKQTNESIAHLLIEETYETIEAIHNKNDKEFSKELGDLLLHIIMHSIMAEEKGAFNLINVITRIQKKLVNRHPHVFGNIEVNGEEDVMTNWEAIKMKEGQDSILQGVPKSLPSLLRAERIQHKASRVGFDWDDKNEVWKKVEEELFELKTELKNGNQEKISEEFGDLLFALVNAARFEKIVPEEALQLTNDKFTKRFQFIENRAKQLNKKLNEMTLKEMDLIWEEAKEFDKQVLS